MVEQLQSNFAAAELDGDVTELLADAGYFRKANSQAVTNPAMDLFIATERLKHNEQIPECAKGRRPGDLTPKQRMARKLRTKKGKETYEKLK